MSPQQRQATTTATATAPTATTKATVDPQWLYSRLDLQCTFSATRHGLHWKRENWERGLAIRFMWDVGELLKLPQITLSTAAVFFHRFYMRESIKDYPPREVSAACLFLAAKVEESNRRLRDVVTEWLKLEQYRRASEERERAGVGEGQGPLSEVDKMAGYENSRDYQFLRSTILFTEDVLLNSLCFDVQLDHPYQKLIHAVRKLYPPSSEPYSSLASTAAAASGVRSESGSGSSAFGVPNGVDRSRVVVGVGSENDDGISKRVNRNGNVNGKGRRYRAKRIVRDAWKMLDDSYLTPVCLLHTPNTIAAAAFMNSCARLGEFDVIGEPGSWSAGHPGGGVGGGGEERDGEGKEGWWDVFDADLDDVYDAASVMREVYANARDEEMRKGVAEMVPIPASKSLALGKEEEGMPESKDVDTKKAEEARPEDQKLGVRKEQEPTTGGGFETGSETVAGQVIVSARMETDYGVDVVPEAGERDEQEGDAGQDSKKRKRGDVFGEEKSLGPLNQDSGPDIDIGKAGEMAGSGEWEEEGRRKKERLEEMKVRDEEMKDFESRPVDTRVEVGEEGREEDDGEEEGEDEVMVVASKR